MGYILYIQLKWNLFLIGTLFSGELFTKLILNVIDNAIIICIPSVPQLFPDPSHISFLVTMTATSCLGAFLPLIEFCQVQKLFNNANALLVVNVV